MSRVRRRFRSLQWKIVVIFLLLILLAMQLISAIFLRSLEDYYRENFTQTLISQGNLLSVHVERYLTSEADLKPTEAIDNIDYLVSQLFGLSGADVQVLNVNGIVLSTNQEQRERVGQKNTRREVSRALQGVRDERDRVDSRTGERVKSIAVPVQSNNRVLGAVYIEASMEAVYAELRQIANIFATGIVLVLFLIAALGLIVTRTITRPIKEVTDHAQAMAEGNYEQQVQVRGTDEIGQLAQAFNHLSQQLRQAIALQREEKEKLNTVLANMSDGVLATDAQGCIIILNRQAERMLRQKESQLLGKTWDDVLLRLDPHVQIAPDKGISLLHVLDEEGDEHVYRLLMTPIRGAMEDALAQIAVLQDVTEQERLDLERRDFVATVSHELRTPLTTLKSYLEALAEGGVESETLRRKFLHVARHETERMIRLVSDLLQLSRLEAKEVQLRMVPFHLGELVQEVADRFYLQTREKGIILETDVAPQLPHVMADPDGMDQVLDNLCSNAIKYTAEGGRIKLTAVSQGQHVTVVVQDSGVGIPESDLPKVFKRFYRVDKARSRQMGGTGLGLSIARQIILAHGGEISLQSVVNQGTTVSFHLPSVSGKKEAVE